MSKRSLVDTAADSPRSTSSSGGDESKVEETKYADDDIIVVNASDKSSLKAFTLWTEGVIFRPVAKPRTRVTVDINRDPWELPPLQCHDCAGRWESSGLPSLLEIPDWGKIAQIDVAALNDRIIPLATAVRGAALHSFSNGQSKAVTFELVGLVRLHGLCKRHTSKLNVTMPSRAMDQGGISVHVFKSHPLTPPGTDSEASLSSPVKQLTCSWDHVWMKGAPDLAVLVEQQPGVTLLIAENKKDEPPPPKRAKTWRETPLYDQCQLGQALFYLLGHQLAAFSAAIPPPPEVCIYMADGNFTVILGKMEVGDGGQLVMSLKVGETAGINYIPKIARLILHSLSR